MSTLLKRKQKIQFVYKSWCRFPHLMYLIEFWTKVKGWKISLKYTTSMFILNSKLLYFLLSIPIYFLHQNYNLSNNLPRTLAICFLLLSSAFSMRKVGHMLHVFVLGFFLWGFKNVLLWKVWKACYKGFPKVLFFFFFCIFSLLLAYLLFYILKLCVCT